MNSIKPQDRVDNSYLQIWYVKQEFFPMLNLGVEHFIRNHTEYLWQLINMELHVHVGNVESQQLSKAFEWCQAENPEWHPQQATHTSMSVGDIIRRGDAIYICELDGFVNVQTGIDAARRANLIGQMMDMDDPRARIRMQLTAWCNGTSIHNAMDNCCVPDGSCCRGGVTLPSGLRQRFLLAFNCRDNETMWKLAGYDGTQEDLQRSFYSLEDADEGD